MQSVIRSIFILFSLEFFAVASAQLPPEIRADAYLLQAEQAIRNGDTFRAQAAIQNILRLQKEHELDLSDEFHFRYAKAADAVDLSEQALESVLKYLVASGREGQHYVEALALMNKTRDRSSGDVVASQLSPNIITDAYLLQAEQAIRGGDHNQARDAIQNIRNLQEQHELDLPNEFHFRYAKAADVLDMPDQALESVVKYLAVSGREGQHYLDALALMNKVQMAVSCKGWDTEDYFKTATLEDVAACLDTGVDLNARDDAGTTPLHRAAKNTENLDVIKALINAGADIEAKDNDKETPLYWATAYNNPVAFKALIEVGADLKVRTIYNKTLLHLVAENNENPNILKMLIDAGADLEVRDDEKRTPLHLAARYNKNPDIIKVLLDAGANLEAQDKDYRTPLYWAVSFNNLPAIKILLNAGANKARVKDKWTPLHWAAAYNKSLDLVKSLLNTGADLKAKDKDKRTPLHVAAAYSENPNVIKALINADADLKAKDKDNWTPLHSAAAYSKNSSVVQTLINAGADLKAKAKNKWMPLHVAAGYNENPDILKVLIDAGADLEAQDNGTPLHVAAGYNENPDILKALINAGADLEARDKDKDTPLHWVALYNKNPDILKVLIDAGAHLEAKNKDNWTPLYSAARYNENPDIVKVLIDAGADLEARDKNKNTPLHVAAAYNKNPDIVKALIEAGADLEARNKDNWTPLHCAVASGVDRFDASTTDKPAVVKILIEAGADLEARSKYSRRPLHLAAWGKPGVVKVLIDAGANLEAQGYKDKTALTVAIETGDNAATIKLLRDAGARNSQQGDGFGKAAAALLGGAAIMYAGKDAEDQEAVTEAVREYMKGVINEQPAGTINPAATSSQSQRGQGQDQLQQALLNLEKICGEKYQGNFSVDDHARFFCLAAFNDYCALKRAKSDEAISKLRASLQQNCAALKKDGLESKCPYCK